MIMLVMLFVYNLLICILYEYNYMYLLALLIVNRTIGCYVPGYTVMMMTES